MKCPSCGSSRVRKGYRTPALPLRLLFIRDLLCDHCNYQFRAFSLRPPAKHSRKRSQHKTDRFNLSPEAEVRLFEQGFSRTQGDVQPAAPPPQPVGSSGSLEGQASVATRLAPHTAKRQHGYHPCPYCGSLQTRRRHRKLWERLVFYFTNIRAYRCLNCSASFYARKNSIKVAPLEETPQNGDVEPIQR
jgi:ribosomal protein L37AE/L43A